MKICNWIVQNWNDFDHRENFKGTDGKSLEIEWTLSPKSEVTPVHIHPAAIEPYEILSGELEVFKKNKWITFGVGEKITIEKGGASYFQKCY